MFASGLINLSVHECADFAAFSQPHLAGDDPLDDVSVFLEDGVELTCDEVREPLIACRMCWACCTYGFCHEVLVLVRL